MRSGTHCLTKGKPNGEASVAIPTPAKSCYDASAKTRSARQVRPCYYSVVSHPPPRGRLRSHLSAIAIGRVCEDRRRKPSSRSPGNNPLGSGQRPLGGPQGRGVLLFAGCRWPGDRRRRSGCRVGGSGFHSPIAECQESRDGGAEQVGDSQTWRGRNDDDGPWR